MNYKYTTQTPNILFDHLIKVLSETQLKVLLTIIRKTIGQVDATNPTKRVQRAWISQRLFCICTGKSARAVSSAIDYLSSQGYILVTAKDGTTLTSKSKRRGASALYYASRLLSEEATPQPCDLSYHNAVKKGHTIKLNEIKESCYNRSQCVKRLSDTERYLQIKKSLKTTSIKTPTPSTLYPRSFE